MLPRRVAGFWVGPMSARPPAKRQAPRRPGTTRARRAPPAPRATDTPGALPSPRPILETQSIARMAAIIEGSLDAIVTIDWNGTIRGFNAAAEVMFGWSRADALGHRLADLLLPLRSRAAGARLLLRGSRHGAAGFVGKGGEMALLRSDGTSFRGNVASVPVPNGETPSFACFFRNAEPVLRAEADLLHTQWQLRELSRRIVAAREEERTHVAREMHDELGQQLTAIRMDVAWLLKSSRGEKRPDHDAVARLQSISDMVESTFGTVHRLITQLRPSMLDDLGLAEAVRWQAREFQARSGIIVSVETTADDAQAPHDHATAIFRIYQELLTNVARHAGATRVIVVLSEAPRQATLVVRDDGRGIVPADVSRGDSFGLVGVRERATSLGGTFTIEGIAGGGTVAKVALPYLKVASK